MKIENTFALIAVLAGHVDAKSLRVRDRQLEGGWGEPEGPDLEPSGKSGKGSKGSKSGCGSGKSGKSGCPEPEPEWGWGWREPEGKWPEPKGGWPEPEWEGVWVWVPAEPSTKSGKGSKSGKGTKSGPGSAEGWADEPEREEPEPSGKSGKGSKRSGSAEEWGAPKEDAWVGGWAQPEPSGKSGKGTGSGSAEGWSGREPEWDEWVGDGYGRI